MRRLAALLALLWLSAPAEAHERRVDRCGCHSQYGLRHCHPRLKTRRCEATVKAVKPTVDGQQSRAESKPPPADLRRSARCDSPPA